MKSCGIHLKAISPQMLKTSIPDMMQITNLKLELNFPRLNEFFKNCKRTVMAGRMDQQSQVQVFQALDRWTTWKHNASGA